MTKQIICINWGTKYGAPYVNKLYAMVARNITGPFIFACFTDDRTGMRPEVLCFDLPEAAGPPVESRGKWPKHRLWSAELGDLTGPVLYLDLDVIVTRSLDAFFEFGDPDDVIMARNLSKPLHRLGQSSIYRFPVGKLEPMQRIFAADPQGTADEYEFEQHFVTKNAPGGVKFWPSGWVSTFKTHCVRFFPLNLFLPPRLSPRAKVVIFAGTVDPATAIIGGTGSRPLVSPKAHLQAAWKSGRVLRNARRYYLPAPWVAEHWRE